MSLPLFGEIVRNVSREPCEVCGGEVETMTRTVNHVGNRLLSVYKIRCSGCGAEEESPRWSEFVTEE